MKIKAPYLYLGFLVWLVLLAAILKFAHLNTTGLGITIFFLTMVLSPGFFLLRLTKIQLSNIAAIFIVMVALGFGFSFTANLLAIFLNLNIFSLILGYLGLGIILYALAF